MSWYVLTTQPQRELAAALRIAACWPNRAGDAPLVYVPQCVSRKGRRRPLFPGYVLSDFDLDQRRYIMASTDYVTGILHGPGQDPVPLDIVEIETIRALEASGAIPADELRAGDWCEVRLRGCTMPGRYVRGNGEATVEVQILGRWLTVRVSTADVRRVA